MKLKSGLTALLAISVLVLPGRADAAGTLDQHQDSVAGACGTVVFGPVAKWAQTFKAGLTGLLDQVDLLPLSIAATGPLTVEIRPLDGNGMPDPVTVLGSGTLASAPPLSMFVPIPLTTPAPVVAGTSYAIVMSTTGAHGEWVACWDSGNKYVDGKLMYATSASGPWSESGDSTADMRFRTYVSTPAQTISFGTTAPAYGSLGGTHDIDATATSALAVTYSVHGSTTNGACTVDTTTGVVSFVAVGNCVIAADQPGDAFYNPAPQALYPAIPVTLTQPQLIDTSQLPTTGAVDTKDQLEATGGASGNKVTFTSVTPGICSVRNNGATLYKKRGVCKVQLDQPGNAEYAAATPVVWSIQVGKP